ncbi:MAG: acyltransferase [Microthrixaceae bacterium]|nr:acyltransferase [Microthrixaceae bacterium]
MGGHALPLATHSFSAIVDVFFVISGFLITTLLLQEHRQTGGVAVRKFYARRLLRLLPGLWVMLAGTAVIGVIIKVSGRLDDPALHLGNPTLKALGKEIVVSALYLHNIVYPTNNGPWIDHLWTLSVEEQFYLLIGLASLIFIVRGHIKAITVVLVALTAAIQISRFALTPGPLGQVAAAVWVQRPDSLMVGMLAAIVSANIADPVPPRVKKALSVAGWVGIPMLFGAVWASTGWARALGIHHAYVPENYGDLLAAGTRPTGFYWIQWGNTVANWGVAAITLCLFRVPDWWPNKLMSWKLLVWVGGALSYPLYLWHVPIQLLMRAFLPHNLAPALWVPLAVVVPFAVAYPSWKYVETRALDLKDRFSVTGNPRHAAASSAASSAAGSAAGSAPGSAAEPTTGPGASQ